MTQSTTVDRAIQCLRELPAAEQTRVAEQLIAYVHKFQKLKTGVDKATSQLKCGETVEITDIDETVDRIAAKHGKA